MLLIFVSIEIITEIHFSLYLQININDVITTQRLKWLGENTSLNFSLDFQNIQPLETIY